MADHKAYAQAKAAAEYITSKLPPELKTPRVGIVCGSGLGGILDTLDPTPQVTLAYQDIPHFPLPTVHGHAGKLVCGKLGDDVKTTVILFVGRAHFYEGYSVDQVTFATRVAVLLHLDTMIYTNAAGGLNPSFKVGDIMLLNDHIYLAGTVGTNPLSGPNADAFGPRFPPMSDAYDLSHRRNAHRAWKSLSSASSTKSTSSQQAENFTTEKTVDDGQVNTAGRTLHEGTYAYVTGPNYETRAECRLLRSWGADVVGMSTVPEIVVARHAGLRVFAMSLVTNVAVLDAPVRGDDEAVQGLDERGLKEYMARGAANHEEVLREGAEAAVVVQSLVKRTVELMGLSSSSSS